MSLLGRLFGVKDKNGIPLSVIKEVFKTQTHSGRYWNIEPVYNILTNTLTHTMRGNESFVYYLTTAEGVRYDEDGDGCSEDTGFKFTLGKSKKKGRKGKIVILKKC
ncbi:hypothetical protein Molly5_176 [Maribacter phage Molly_5]|uniref:Uncharacterized protein n=1 Tax=Maribacter phage Molly_1 TaxID=2745685 RepID=A0A8E4XXY2_9CAUD|nr:hypothetical protein M1M29_gp176 [Maribacter phage Molly_1]QQO97673.1 hypothetical protein Molly2_176 [Maribacter phage Molly_2]QQO97873.1 hypothetical protein Molly3_176 [Maribacter phage Molly_3]QQO98073.1 hypothetical protein Molly4_176 [Maribacter phage Molly_4]QQO98273.1 hypothetical protein Molly5_176 [Maribacter phage Molly_5]QQO97473.1 hypothetical protein Molly1_176 [Maribacter phage Molly_1]